MKTRHGYIGAVPTQDKDDGNKGLLDVNSYSILQRRDQIRKVAIPPIPSGMSLRIFLDAGQPGSYNGSGNTWTDLSGSGRNATLFNPSHQTTTTPNHFAVSSTFSFSTPNNTLSNSNNTFFMVQATTDTQSMLITDDGSQDYLGAYRSGNKYYSANVNGGKNLYVNGSSAANLYDTIRTGSSQLIVVTDCDFNFSTQQIVYNNYGSFIYDSSTELYAMGVYNGNLSASQVTDLYNWFNGRGYIGLSV